MTDEERERQKEFILSMLASASAKIDATAESLAQAERERKASEQERKASELERKADAVRISRLEDSFVAFSKLFERMYERLDDHQSRVESVEDAIVSINKLSERIYGRLDEHQSRIVDVEGAIVILTKLLDRGGNGTP
jgi:chromosome segregation ATPase